MGTSASSSSRYLFSLTSPLSGYLLQTTRFRGQVPRVRGVTLGSRMRVRGLLGRRSPIPSQIPASVLTMMSQHTAGNPCNQTSAANRSIGSTTGCTITEKAPTRAFSFFKAPTSAFTFKTLLSYYAKLALTPR